MAARQTAQKYNGYTVRTVARLANVTVRTVQTWRDDGLLTPSITRGRGHGSYDVYSFSDLLAVRAAHRLHRSGMPIDGMKKVLAYIQQRGTNAPARGVFVLSDGDTVMEKRGDELVSVFQQPGQPATLLVISLETVEKEVRQAIGA